MTDSKVVCAICGERFGQITNSHLKKHDISLLEYNTRFPGAEITSSEVKTKLSILANNRDMSGENSPSWNGGFVEVTCEICGKVIKVIQCEKDTRRFCSRKCMGVHQSKNCTGESAYRWNGGLVKCICEYCGKEYNVKKNESEHTHFCSQSCAGKNLVGANNPNYGNNWSNEARKNLSVRTKERFKDKSNHPRWRGGTSFEPYCTKFNTGFKESIRDRFDRLCFICGKSEVDNGRRLDVHHVNYDKNCLCNDIDCEFVPLCISCHSKTNSNRQVWEQQILDKLGALN